MGIEFSEKIFKKFHEELKIVIKKSTDLSTTSDMPMEILY